MKTAIIVAVILLVLFVVKSRAQSTGGAYKNINVSEFKSKMKESNVVLLDVRTPSEIKNGKINKSKELDFMNSSFKSRIDSLDKSKTYLVYCRSGNRSAKACKVMSAKGFENLYNLKGGFSAWTR